MKERGINKRALMITFLMTTLFGCSQPSASDDPKTVSVETERDIVWKDLRIQKLLPGFIALPAVEPYLPANFVAIRDPKHWDKIYWGSKDILEKFFENGHLQSAVICVTPSGNMVQIDENHFSDERSGAGFISYGIKNFVNKKWKWGTHPVMSWDATIDDKEVNLAWIGLNQNGHVLCATLVYPPSQHVPSVEDLKMWSDFLNKTTPLAEHEFYKVHGLDLSEGSTLVKVYESVLKVSAEKRTRDGKIQINIWPKDQTISCKCLAIGQTLMPAKSRFSGPVVKIQSEIQVSSDADVISRQTITVLLKEVSEFSNHKDVHNANSVAYSEYGNISVANFCERELVMKTSP